MVALLDGRKIILKPHESNFMYTTSIYILPKILSSSILVSFCKPCIIASRYGNSSREASLSMSSLDIKYADKSCCGLKLHWISGSVFVLFMHRFGNSFFEISSTESIAPIIMTIFTRVVWPYNSCKFYSCAALLEI